MADFDVDENQYRRDGNGNLFLDAGIVHRFSSEVLGLVQMYGSKKFDGVAAMFDLEGFTTYCNDPTQHLFLPGFLDDFLQWFMLNLRKATVIPQSEEDEEGSDFPLLHRLPRSVKFLGDGLLVVWDVTGCTDEEIDRIPFTSSCVANNYQYQFLPFSKTKSPSSPRRLRCGVARGDVIALRNTDYVGACINMASRLQKLPGAGFAAAKKGFSRIHLQGEELVLKVGQVDCLGKQQVFLRKSE